MTNNKQSSVEFFLYEMFSLLGEFENKALPSYKIMDLFEQAKAMHKEERISDYLQGANDEAIERNARERFLIKKDAIRWYNETFGGNK